jgi:hypothetical protein
MLVPISTIRAQENLRTSFDESINFLRAFIVANSNSDSRNVSSFAAEGSSKRKDNPNFKKKQGFNKKYKDSNTGQDRFYKPAEWWKLDQKTRDKIVALRANRKVASTSTAKDDDSTEITSNLTTQRDKRVKFAT